MKKKTILFLVLMLLFLALLPSFSQGQEEIIGWFLTGNSYLNLSEEFKLSYVGGLTDMLSEATSLYVPELYPYLYETIQGMSGIQLMAIFDKYLEEYPEERHFSAASIFYVAIMEIVNENIK